LTPARSFRDDLRDYVPASQPHRSRASYRALTADVPLTTSVMQAWWDEEALRPQ